MENYSVYEDMSSRTGGDIYVGVVGPVRTGKSTFIKRFMEELVIPVADPSRRAVMIDELPQSSYGKTVMTTEPKFVPAKAEKIKIREGAEVSVRLVDCVGFAVDGANGFEEDGAPRLVNTPWQEEPIPFERAAEIGTQKVITDHSTIGVMVTTDGSVTDLPRENYIKAEERAVAELKRIGKPFVVLLNCKDPSNASELKTELETKYEVPVVATNVERMTETDFLALLGKILFEFPVLQVDVKIPKWLQALPQENKRIEYLKNALQKISPSLVKMKDCFLLENLFEDGDGLISPKEILMDLGTGRVEIFVSATEKYFYETLSDECGESIDDDYRLFSFVRELSGAKRNYDKIKDAFENAEKNGYGMVVPTETELLLAEPKLVKKSAGYGVKFKASAPAYHVVKIDVTGEVNPIVGTKQQGEEFVKEALESYEAGTDKVWQTNIFGKSLKELVMDELSSKTSSMPIEIRKKLRRTMMRVVNEGKGGIICILL
jgi:stage IV sporulation protein A